MSRSSYRVLIAGAIAVSAGCLRPGLISPVDAEVPRAPLVLCNKSPRSFSVRANAYGLIGLENGQCVPVELLLGANALVPAGSANLREWFQDAGWVVDVPAQGARVIFGSVADRLRLLAVQGLGTAPAKALRCHRPGEVSSTNVPLDPPMGGRVNVIRWVRENMVCE
jgi:hypothetical protein